MHKFVEFRLISNELISINPCFVESIKEIDNTPPACRLTMASGKVFIVNGKPLQVIKKLYDQE